MRRLATQTRGGAVSSQRDYQSIMDLGQPLCFAPDGDGPAGFTLTYEAGGGVSQFAGVGGYLAAINMDAEVQVAVHAPGHVLVSQHTFLVEGQRYWTRVGFPWELRDGIPPSWTVTLRWNAPARLLVWGLNCGVLPLPLTLQQVIGEKGWPDILKPSTSPRPFTCLTIARCAAA